jgi:hypothetical protein
MVGNLDRVCCASLPLAMLPAVAGLRTRADVRAGEAGGQLWLWWSPGDAEVLSRILPIPGIELFERRDGLWFRHGGRLPTPIVPGEDVVKPLASVVTPCPVVPLEPGRERERVSLSLVRDGRFHPATAVLCALTDLARWADSATSFRVEGLRATRHKEKVLVCGGSLPPLPGQRWWGRDILIPAGFRPEPDLPESALTRALSLSAGDVVLLTAEGAERIPATAFGTLSRASIRLAFQEQV